MNFVDDGSLTEFNEAKTALLATPGLVREGRLLECLPAFSRTLRFIVQSVSPEAAKRALASLLVKALDIYCNSKPYADLNIIHLRYIPGQEQWLLRQLLTLRDHIVKKDASAPAGVESQPSAPDPAQSMAAVKDDLTLEQAKQKLSTVSGALRQGDLAEALRLVESFVNLLSQARMIKAERESWSANAQSALQRINASKEFMALGLPPLAYAAGQEKEFLTRLSKLQRKLAGEEDEEQVFVGFEPQEPESQKPMDAVQARQTMMGMGAFLKDGRLIEALRAFRTGLEYFLSYQMVKNEREQLFDLCDKLVTRLILTPEYRRLNVSLLKYERGQERKLAQDLEIMESEIRRAWEDQETQAQRETLEKLRKTIQRGNELLDAGELKRGAALLKNLITEPAASANVLIDFGQRLLAMDEPMYALDFLEGALKRQPEDAGLTADIAKAYQMLQKFDKAEDYYLRAIELGNPDPQIAINLGWLYLLMRKIPEAFEAARQAVANQPDSEEAQKLYASAEKRFLG